jgi:hypothetical protein
MAARAVTLHLPGPLFEKIERRAQEAHHSIEAELLEVVSTAVPAAEELSPDLSSEVSALRFLDDEALLQAARTRLPLADAQRMEELHRIDRRAGLSEPEAKELADLERQYEKVLLVRSHAARLLAQRGNDISGLISGE